MVLNDDFRMCIHFELLSPRLFFSFSLSFPHLSIVFLHTAGIHIPGVLFFDLVGVLEAILKYGFPVYICVRSGSCFIYTILEP